MIYLIQRRVAEYRVGIFEALASAVPDLVVVTDAPPPAGVSFQWVLSSEFQEPPSLLRMRQKLKPNDIIISGLNLRSLSSILLFLKMRKRYILWGHGFGRGRHGFLGRLPRLLAARLSAASLFYTPESVKIFSRLTSPEKLFVANNTISLPTYIAPKNKPLDCFLYFGDLREEKGVDLLIDAFSIVASDNEGLRLVIVGDGDCRPQLVSQARSKTCANRIQFFPRTTKPEDLKEHLDTAFATVSPLHVGLSVVQSFWAGVPIITQKNSYHAPEFSFCEDGKNCILFSGGVPGLTTAMSHVLDTERRNHLSLNCREFYRESLSPQAMVEGFVQSIEFVQRTNRANSDDQSSR